MEFLSLSNRLRAAAHAQLAKDVTHVDFDRGNRQIQLLRNLGIGQAPAMRRSTSNSRPLSGSIRLWATAGRVDLVTESSSKSATTVSISRALPRS